jgi:hypothetical protein
MNGKLGRMPFNVNHDWLTRGSTANDRSQAADHSPLKMTVLF